MPDLKIAENGQDWSVTVGPDGIRVGRASENDVVLTEQRASRQHCVIEVDPRGVRVRDLGSANGTRVNGDKVLQKIVRPGDEIRIGDATLSLAAEERPDRPAPRRRPARRGGAAILLIPAILLGVGLLLLGVLSTGRDEEIRKAGEAIARAELDTALRQTEPKALERELRAFLDAYPDSRWAEPARRRLDEVRTIRERAANAEEALAAVERLGEELAPDEVVFRYEALGRRFRDVAGFAEKVGARIDELERQGRAVAEEDLRVLLEQVGRQLAEEDFAAAVAGLNRFFYRHGRLHESARQRAGDELARVLARAGDAYRALESQVDALRAADRETEALALLRAAETRFAGTRFGTQARLKGQSLREDARVAEAGASPEAAAARKEQADRRLNVALLAQEAEELARASLFDRAIERFRQIVESSRDVRVRAEYAGRIDDLVRIRDLLARVRLTARKDPQSLKPVTIGGVRGKVVGGTEEVVLLSARGATVRKRWAEMAIEDLVELIDAMETTPQDLLALAVLRFDRGDRDGWIATLLTAMEHEELKETADAIYARKEGMDLPEGGFVAYGGRILTPTEHRRERSEELIAGLLQGFADQLGKLDAQPSLKAAAKMRKKRAELEAARKHAIELIYDEKRFFYPYNHRLAEYEPVKREVLDRLAAVRKIWDDPARVVLRRTPEANRALERCREIAKELETQFSYGTRPLHRALANRLIYLPEEPTAVTIRTFALDPGDAERLDYDRRVMAYNEALGGVAQPTEIDQVRITNEYRMMMGRPALKRNDKLVMAARKHSEEMSRLGYFGHFSPIPERRDPMKRVRLEGYKGMPVSENCHMGSGNPQGAHDGWIRSSGHHRNLLSATWTEMGTGRSGRLWTQNFGRTKRLPEETPPK
jgi:uncharacterized protein YkwD